MAISNNARLAIALENGGLQNAAVIVQASALERLGLSYCCAMIENESGGRNIFGADPAGDALPREWYDTPVTHEKFEVFWANVQRGMTSNGVGPAQLTSPSLISAANARGGTWIPLHNMTEGFAFLKSLFEQHDGPLGGFTAYNGSGPAAEAYGQRAVALAEQWQARINTALGK
jgi:hypothetical protein